ncbi:MAG: MogA/MoaB family molybdenum cofactor biosynthesis protein [Deltaproteobacteria bacterium]|nr:MogA/MoaB family molybdenum cofactor biosynthesis protein [Deltaproteobacteria bacterium]
MNAAPPPAPAVATITVSDSRNESTDSGGALLREMLQAAGFRLGGHAIVADEAVEIQKAVSTFAATPGVDAIVLTGGTGIGPRDVTVDAVEPLYARKLDGFGEAFRRLSWDQVGARAVLSRASAGTIESRLVFVLPGSPKAVALGVEKLIVPLLQHAMHMIAGGGHHHHGP